MKTTIEFADDEQDLLSTMLSAQDVLVALHDLQAMWRSRIKHGDNASDREVQMYTEFNEAVGEYLY